MRTRIAQTLVAGWLATTVAGCGFIGVKGAGLDAPNKSSLNPNCTSPPYELPASCPLGGIGADIQTFNDSHLYAGSTVVIPGSTNFLAIMTSMGRVTSFEEHFHANPPLTDHEARVIAHAEVPADGKKLFTKTIAGRCVVLEYRSKVLRTMYGKPFSAALIVLRSDDPSALDQKNITKATISLTAPHSAASVTSC